MDFNKEKGTAAAFAQIVWVACGLFLYLTTPGTALFSGSAGVFIVFGALAAALVFGLGAYGLRRLIPATATPDGAPSRRSRLPVALMIAEAAVIFVVAGVTFQALETVRVGVPIEFVAERRNFDAAMKAFSDANRLEEQAKPGREAGQIDADLETQLVALMEDGIARANAVGDPFLAYLDPELPGRYRTELIRGYEMLVQGRRSGDLMMQTDGNELVRQFYQEFLPDRADAILGKLGVRPQ